MSEICFFFLQPFVAVGEGTPVLSQGALIWPHSHMVYQATSALSGQVCVISLNSYVLYG